MDKFVYLGTGSTSPTLLGISVDTIFTTLITIFIFVFGYLLNRYYENKKEKNRLLDVKSFFIIYIESLLKPLDKFINSINDLSTNLKDLNERGIKFSETSKLSINVNIIDQLDLFKVFVFDEKENKDKKIYHLKNILSSLVTIDKTKSNTKDTFFRFHSDLRRYENVLRENWNFILRQFDIYISTGMRNPSELVNDSFMSGLKEIFSEWNKNEKKDSIDITKKILIEPIREYCKLKIEDERTLQLVPATVGYNDAYMNITVLREIYSDVFSEVKDDLISEKSKIIESLEYLK